MCRFFKNSKYKKFISFFFIFGLMCGRPQRTNGPHLDKSPPRNYLCLYCQSGFSQISLGLFWAGRIATIGIQLFRKSFLSSSMSLSLSRASLPSSQEVVISIPSPSYPILEVSNIAAAAAVTISLRRKNLPLTGSRRFVSAEEHNDAYSRVPNSSKGMFISYIYFYKCHI